MFDTNQKKLTTAHTTLLPLLLINCHRHSSIFFFTFLNFSTTSPLQVYVQIISIFHLWKYQRTEYHAKKLQFLIWINKIQFWKCLDHEYNEIGILKVKRLPCHYLNSPYWHWSCKYTPRFLWFMTKYCIPQLLPWYYAEVAVLVSTEKLFCPPGVATEVQPNFDVQLLQDDNTFTVISILGLSNFQSKKINDAAYLMIFEWKKWYFPTIGCGLVLRVAQIATVISSPFLCIMCWELYTKQQSSCQPGSRQNNDGATRHQYRLYSTPKMPNLVVKSVISAITSWSHFVNFWTSSLYNSRD